MNKFIIFLIIIVILAGGAGAFYLSPAGQETFNRFFKKGDISSSDNLENSQAAGQTPETVSDESAGGAAEPLPAEGSAKTFSAAEFEALVARLPEVKRKIEAKEILKDERYLSLVDFSVPIVSEEKGNPAPFKKREVLLPSFSKQKTNR